MNCKVCVFQSKTMWYKAASNPSNSISLQPWLCCQVLQNSTHAVTIECKTRLHRLKAWVWKLISLYATWNNINSNLYTFIEDFHWNSSFKWYLRVTKDQNILFYLCANRHSIPQGLHSKVLLTRDFVEN